MDEHSFWKAQLAMIAINTKNELVLYTHVGRQYVEFGKANGFKLFSIKPGSIYSKIGLKNGDIVHKINGYEMNSPDKALDIYQKLRSASSISVELTRRGRNQVKNYSIR